MSSADIFNGIGDISYWAFENTLEPISDGDAVWWIVLIFGFIAFGYWMFRQAQYNKQAEADPNQIK